MADQPSEEPLWTKFGVVNLRPAAPGHVTSGFLYRSGDLSTVPFRIGQALAQDLGVRRVVDLRSELEMRRSPDSLEDHGIEVVECPLAPGSLALKDLVSVATLSLQEVYRHLVLDEPKQLTHAIRAVAQSPGPVIVHCTAGKDRTGLVIALILDAVGVDRQTIVEDYTLSEQLLGGEWAQRLFRTLESAGIPLTNRLHTLVTASPADVIGTSLDLVAERWESSSQYLTAHGMTGKELDRLRRTLCLGDPR